MKVEVANHEWSESGLKLLQQFKTMIVKGGGNIRVALDIELELKKDKPYVYEKIVLGLKRNCNHVPWSREEKNFVLENYKYMTAEDMALQMKRTPYAVQRKITHIKNQIKINNGTYRKSTRSARRITGERKP